MEKKEFLKNAKGKISAFIAASLILTGCWGWWWGTNNSWIETNQTINTLSDSGNWTKKVVYWKVIDDPISWANVTIKTLDWNVVYQTKTDSNWTFTIDVNMLKNNLYFYYGENVDIEKTTLIIESQWWIEIYTQDPFKWKMIAIKLENENLSNIVVNPLSTKLVEEVKQQWYKLSEVNEQIIKQVIMNLQVRYWNIEDVDWDWQITIEDFNRYNPDDYESELEENLRQEWYFNKLKQWLDSINDEGVNFENIKEEVEKFIKTSENIDENKIKEIKTKQDLVEKLEDRKLQIEEEIKKITEEISKLKEKLNSNQNVKQILDEISKLEKQRQHLLEQLWEIKYLLDKDNLTEQDIEEALGLISRTKSEFLTRSINYKIFNLTRSEDDFLKNRKEKLIKQLNNLEKIETVLEDQIQQIENKIKDVKRQIQEKDEDIQELQLDIDSIDSQISSLQEKIREYQEDISKAKQYLKDRNDLVSKVNTAKENMDYWYNESGKYSEEYFNKRYELDILSDIPSEYNYKFFESNLSYKWHDIKIIWYRQNSTTQLPFILVSYIDGKILKDEVLLIQTVSEMNENVPEYKKYLQLMIDRNIAYKNYEIYKNEYEELKNQQKSLKNEILNFVKKYKKEDWTYYSISQLINDAKQEIEKLKSEKESKLEELQLAKQEKEKLKDNLNLLKDELARKKAQLENIKTKINNIRSKLPDYKQVVTDEIWKIDEYYTVISSDDDEIQEKLSQKEKDLEDLQTEKQEIEQQIQANKLTNELKPNDPLYYDEVAKTYIYDLDKLPTNPTRLIWGLRYRSPWYMKTPYTLYVLYWLNSVWTNYPAKVWVEYEDSKWIKLFKEEIVNNYEYKEYIKNKFKKEIEQKLKNQFVESWKLNVKNQQIEYWIRKDDEWKYWWWYKWRWVIYKISGYSSIEKLKQDITNQIEDKLKAEEIEVEWNKSVVSIDLLQLWDKYKEIFNSEYLEFLSTYCTPYGQWFNYMWDQYNSRCDNLYERLKKKNENEAIQLELLTKINQALEKTNEVLKESSKVLWEKIEVVKATVNNVLDKAKFAKGMASWMKDVIKDTAETVKFVWDILADEASWILLKAYTEGKKSLGMNTEIEERALDIILEEIIDEGNQIDEWVELIIEMLGNLHELIPYLIKNLDSETAWYVVGYIWGDILITSAVTSATGWSWAGAMIKNAMWALEKTGVLLKRIVNVSKLVKDQKIAKIILELWEKAKKIWQYAEWAKTKVWLELESTARAVMVFMDKIVKPYRWNYALVEQLPEWYIKDVVKDIETGRITELDKKFFAKVGEEGIDNVKDMSKLKKKDYFREIKKKWIFEGFG